MSDLIDKQQAIEAICMETCGVSLRNERCMVHCTEVQAVEQLPPAQPERIKGHWIEHDDGLVACECSVCHEKYNLYEEDVFERNFCPNCGADMREVTT